MLSRSIFVVVVVVYVSLCVSFTFDSRWVKELFFSVLISYYWLMKYPFILQYILLSLKFCASIRGYTLEAFECIQHQVVILFSFIYFVFVVVR